MDELAGVLSRERLMLELLLFKLVELRHLLASGEGRFLAWAAEEVERATAKVREIELRRAVAVVRAGEQAGLDDAPTLLAIAERAPAPYRVIFEDHRRALLALTNEVEQALDVTRRLASAGAHAVREVLDRVAGDDGELATAGATTYGPAGAWTAPAAEPRVWRSL